jgi:sulfite exporter TauE/SafE
MTSAAVCNPVSLTAAFLVGMAGSMHCVAMCGGISGALGMRARRISGSRRTSMLTLLHQVGRVASYTLAGAIVGACSGLILSIFDVNKLALGARIAGGSVLVAIAVNILFKWRSLGLLERSRS